MCIRINNLFNKPPSVIYKNVGGALVITGIVLAALGGIALFQHTPFSQTMMETLKYKGCMSLFAGGCSFIVIGLGLAGYSVTLENPEKRRLKEELYEF